MIESFKITKRIPHHILQERMETIKELSRTNTASYDIVKDKETGEHYLLHYYEHLLIADNNHRETYYHLMPLESDNVLAIILEEQSYTYPDYWKNAYLRNSSDDNSYVWFDPAHQVEFEQNEEIGARLKQMLAAFKQNGALDEESVKKLLRDLDQL